MYLCRVITNNNKFMSKRMFAVLIVAIVFFVAHVEAQEKQKKVYMVADAHLDTQWNWDVQATIKSHIWNTMVQNFRLFEQYPHYIFNFEGAVKYAWMKEYYPAQYELLKGYVAKGRWHIAGSSWDANEVILCSPESWIRNILLGQTYYREEFGTEATDVFLPDCFGFPYTMPTLARHCGLIGFSSQKLMWRSKPFYEGNKKYPFSAGLWQGIDGSKIMMVHGFDYARRWNDEDLSKSDLLMKEVAESPLNIAYRYYGTGDIGGSPNLPSVRSLEKGVKGDGPIKIISATSDQIYRDFWPYERHPELPEFRGELTMDLHGNGCYTSQAAMKLYNRQNEHLGDAAERAAVMADWAGTYKYPIDHMKEIWKRTIWHQFHDDVTGTSIPRAYEFSWNDELLSLKQFSEVLTTSVSGVARQMDTNVGGQPVVVYNNEAFPVTTIAEVEVAAGATVSGPDGNPVRSQVVEKADKRVLLFEATVPATGFAVYSVKTGGAARLLKTETGTAIENSRYKIVADENGDIQSLYDKQAGRELVADGQRIRLVVFDDCTSTSWPAWEIQKATLDKAPVGIKGAIVSVENGPLCKTLVIRKQYGQSDIVQRIHLYEGTQACRVDFENSIDWCSENSLLKAEFPLSVSNPEATYDIGLGSVKRGNNRDNQFEVYSHEWTDLTDKSGNYGVTILNNARYGWDKPADNTLRHSLLFTPKPGNGYRYQAQQDMGHHVFTYSLIGHEGQLNEPEAVRQAAILNSPLKAFFTTRHKGELGKTFSFVTSDNASVMVRALKQAEVTDEYVVRVYEIGGKSNQSAKLTFAGDIVQAVEADGTEKTIGQASFTGKQLNVSINPYGVRTYKIKLAKRNAAATVPVQPLQLTFDRRPFSFNEFRGDGNFDGGYSYAAELLPKDGRLTVDGIVFQLGEPDAQSGLSCKGQTIGLPAGYKHLYILAASDNGDRKATLTLGKTQQTASVPYYTGFIGQWGHDGHTKGYLKNARVAYVGTHRHSAAADEAYEFTYMYLLKFDIPKGCDQVTLPNDEHIVLFAATVANDDERVVPSAPLFDTSLMPGEQNMTELDGDGEAMTFPNLLKNAKIIAVSGEVNAREQASNLVDDNPETKWCDTKKAPNFVTFDLGAQKEVSHWRLLNAGSENSSFITRTCLLQGRNSLDEEWQTLDLLDANRTNNVSREFTKSSVRYIRLFVISPTQLTGDAARIYELGVW